MPEDPNQLSETPDSPDKERAKLEEDRKEVEESQNEEERRWSLEVQRTSSDLSDRLNSLELTELKNSAQSIVEQVQTESARDALEVVQDQSTDPRLTALEKELNQLTERLKKPSEQEKKNYNLAVFGTITGVIVSGIGTVTTIGIFATGVAALIYMIIHNSQTEDDDSSDAMAGGPSAGAGGEKVVGGVTLPADAAAAAEKLVQALKKQTDASYWGNFAAYAEKKAQDSTIADQILFMNYTVDLFPGKPWLWKTAADKADMVDQLFGIYEKAGGQTAAMYRQVLTLKYNGQVMSRPVAAGVLRLAMAKALVQARESQEVGTGRS